MVNLDSQKTSRGEVKEIVAYMYQEILAEIWGVMGLNMIIDGENTNENQRDPGTEQRGNLIFTEKE